MSLFSTNRHNSLYENYEFSDIDGYGGPVGPLMAIVEGYQNDLTLMTLEVQSDMDEIMAVNEGSDLVVLQEAGISGMLEAIKQFFIKLGQKIKAIFTKFIAKLDQYFMSDTKAFVKKYDKILRDRNYEKMSCKFSKPKIDPPVIYLKGDIYTIGENPLGLGDIKELAKKIRNADISRSDILEYIYKKYTNNTADNKSEFEEWYHEQLFEDEETEDTWDYSKIKPLCNFLEDSNKTINNCEKINKSLQKAVKDAIKDIEKMQKNLSSEMKTDKYNKDTSTITKSSNKYIRNITIHGDEGTERYRATNRYMLNAGYNNSSFNSNDMQTYINYLRTEASCFQEVVLVYCNRIMQELKFHIAQCKKVIATAVQQKSGTSESSLLKAVGDVAFDEVYEYFDSESV